MVIDLRRLGNFKFPVKIFCQCAISKVYVDYMALIKVVTTDVYNHDNKVCSPTLKIYDYAFLKFINSFKKWVVL